MGDSTLANKNIPLQIGTACITTAITENNATPSPFLFYPNPVSGKLYVSSLTDAKPEKRVVTDEYHSPARRRHFMDIGPKRFWAIG